jgi:aldehyde:ferredoxin oxidoreductase
MVTAVESGPIEGSAIASEDLERFKSRFYEVMGWDPETGEPTEECLGELALDRLLAF